MPCVGTDRTELHAWCALPLPQDNATKKLMPARNWLHVEELPVSQPGQDGQPGGAQEREHKYTK